MNSETTYQLVLPVEYREMVLKGLHDDAGHQGRDRTLYLVTSRFYWPGHQGRDRTLYLVKSRFYWPGVNKDVEKKLNTSHLTQLSNNCRLKIPTLIAMYTRWKRVMLNE
jgi:hypothetical protein